MFRTADVDYQSHLTHKEDRVFMNKGSEIISTMNFNKNRQQYVIK